MGEDKILRKHILLVEDESIVRASIGRLLSRDELTVVEANNGAEALSLFTTGQFDLVIRKRHRDQSACGARYSPGSS